MVARNTSDIDGLREIERLAVDLLARGQTCREIATKLNISERTLYAWRRKPAVQRAVYALQQELMDAGGGQGITVVPMAIETLTAIMNDPEARASDRIAASRTLISGAQAFQERKHLERTISDLEAQLFGALRQESAPSANDDVELLRSADPEEDF